MPSGEPGKNLLALLVLEAGPGLGPSLYRPPDRQESPSRPAGRETEVCMCECVCVHVCVCTQSDIQSQEASASLAVYMEGSHSPRVEHCPPCPCRTTAQLRASQMSSWFQSRTQGGARRKRPCSVGEVSPSPQFSVPPPRLVSSRFSSDSIQIISCFSNTHQIGDGRASLAAQL